MSGELHRRPELTGEEPAKTPCGEGRAGRRRVAAHDKGWRCKQTHPRKATQTTGGRLGSPDED